MILGRQVCRVKKARFTAFTFTNSIGVDQDLVPDIPFLLYKHCNAQAGNYPSFLRSCPCTIALSVIFGIVGYI